MSAHFGSVSLWLLKAHEQFCNSGCSEN